MMADGANIVRKPKTPENASTPNDFVTVKKYVESEKLAPNNKGPNVRTAQNTRSRGNKDRGRMTRNIAFNEDSIVPSSKIAMIARPTIPTAVSCAVLPTNWSKYTPMASADVGIKFSNTTFWNFSRTPPNTGNAASIEKAIAVNGTIASKEVKLSDAAKRRQSFSTNRCHKKPANRLDKRSRFDHVCRSNNSELFDS
jgi:hypothetical protein